MPAGQNHSNFALNPRLSAARYDKWCKIQVLKKKRSMCSAFLILKYLRRHTLRHTSPPVKIKIKAVIKVCKGHIPFPFLKKLILLSNENIVNTFFITILNFGSRLAI
jgi:hypothetical protein